MSPLRASTLLMTGVLFVACGDDTPMPDTDAGCASAMECDDGLFCNGEELCNMGSCMPGTAPCGDAACMEAPELCADECTEPDSDGDGVDRVECGGDDCDDEDANRYPGNTEICDSEGVDEDCDPTTVGDRDVDGDGHTDSACCNGDTCGDDCADRLPDFFTGATETCDLRDQDCDGNVDEGVSVTLFVDTDGDLYGDETEVLACAGSARTSASDIDCENDNPQAHGAQLEVCDGMDNDCDGDVDEDTVVFPWYPDTDGDGFGDPGGTPVVSCAPPADHSLLPLDCDDSDGTLYPAADELCNARDDNCDGVAGFVISRGDTEDDDRDGYADAGCGGDDCDDRDPFNYPGGLELCDDLDNDCDGTVDEDSVDVDWYLDADGDGYGDSDDVVTSCERQLGRVLVGGDCADANSNLNPGQLELCNGIDDDCDGDVDEGGLGSLLAFRDMDGDNYGDPDVTEVFCAGAIDAGYVAVAGDCDDSTMEIRPGVADSCNTLDDDCDSAIDEDGAIDWYADFDGDDYGTGGVVLTQCEEPANAADNADDCNDENENIAPMTPELCDEIDQDCDTDIDEGLPDEIFYMDLDGDGSAAIGATAVLQCRATGNLVPTRTDCDDTDENVFVGATEVCDGIDNNCSGTVDDDGVSFCTGADVTGVCLDGGVTNQCECMTAGLADCDGNQGNGCETTLATSNLHCGACGNACSDSEYCDSGTCATAALVGMEGGATTMCGEREGGRFQCWGQSKGLIGGNSSTAQLATALEPYDVFDFSMSLDFNYWHHCAIVVDPSSSDRDIYCMGRNGYGQLGRGFTTSPFFDFVAIGRIDTTVDEMNNDWEELSVGGGYTLARRANGEIWGWGLQDRGQLTQATNQNYLTPVRVAPTINDAIAITANWRGACALRMGGTVECWGGDTNGALGNGPGGSTATPTQVLVLGDTPLTNAVQVTMAGSGGCARRGDGTVWCWGAVRGDGVTGEAQNAVQTMSVAGASDVSCGDTSCCAAAGGNAWCWGTASVGQLGDGDPMVSNYNPPVQVLTSAGPPLGGVIDVEGGRAFNCARTNTQQMVCWGEGAEGQLGRGVSGTMADRSDAGAPDFVMGL